MTTQNFEKLDHTLGKFRASPLLPIALKELNDSSKAINNDLYQTISTEIPEYLAANYLISSKELKQHLACHTQCLINIISSGQRVNFEFVEEFNQLRAVQHFSLESNLHLYRLCQKVYSRQLRNSILRCNFSRNILADAIAAVDDLMFEYTNSISTTAARCYVEQTRIITQAAGDRRAEILNCLLSGYDETDSQITSILDESGYLDSGQLFCVAVAQSVDPKQMLNHERARRMADSINKLFSTEHGNRLIDVHDNKVIMIFSNLKRISGWSKPREGFSRIISKQLAMVGNAAYIGISTDVKKASFIPKAYKQAQMALKLAKPTQRVICTADLSVYKILVQLSGKEIQYNMPEWTAKFYQADDKSAGSLSMSLRAYAKTNMNILKAGAVLSVHPNTIYSRIHRIRELTGLDARQYDALTELLLICDIRYSKDRD